MACIVNITGTGYIRYCYATVNGTQYASATSGITLTSNTITFCVKRALSTGGTVTIDGNTVYALTYNTTGTYEWIVPDNVTQVDISLVYNSGYAYSDITVTTTSARVTAHKTMVDGTVYSITGGKTMVGGTVYDIAGGKTMVGGTVYDIAFGAKTHTVTITGTGDSTYTYVTINGTKYTSVAIIEVEDGTEITCQASNAYSSTKKPITLNGTTVASGGTSAATYTHAVTSDVTVTLAHVAKGNPSVSIEET